MKKLIVVGLMVVMCLLLSVSCTKAAAPVPVPAQDSISISAPAPATTTPAPTPMPTPIFTNAESDSRVAELEAMINQLESDNQRLLAENQQLNTSLEIARSDTSEILIMVTEIANDSRELAAFLESLPDLPPPPPGLDDISRVNDAIEKAKFLRTLLEKLPPLPFFAPPLWHELDEMKGVLIDMTDWIGDLKELPDFLTKAGDLDSLRYQEISHLEKIAATMDDIKKRLSN